MRHTIKTSAYIVSCLLLMVSLSGCPPTPGPLPPRDIPTPPPVIREQLTAEWAYQQGLQALNLGNPAAAIQQFYLTIQRDPLHQPAYLGLGDAYQMQGEYLMADTFYNQVLERDLYSIPALTGLAVDARHTENDREALNLFRKILELDPGNQFAQQQIDEVTHALVQFHYQQGMLERNAGDLALAAVEFQKAYSFSPDNPELAVEIGDLFLVQHDYLMAERFFQEALTTHPEYVPAFIGIGKVHLAQKQYNEAIQTFQQATRLAPTDTEAARLLRQAQQDKLAATVPAQYWEIMARPHVTRGDIAALLMIELQLEERLPPPAKVGIISDITTHWAKSYIIKVVQYGVMRLPPDRFFQPDDPMPRGELAFTLDLVLQKLGVTLPSASDVKFSDVHPDNAYHDAIVRIYAAGVMTTALDRAFGMRDALTGDEALQIFERVKALLN